MTLLLAALVMPSTTLLLLRRPFQALLNMLFFSVALVATMTGYPKVLWLIPLCIAHALVVLGLQRRRCCPTPFYPAGEYQ